VHETVSDEARRDQWGVREIAQVTVVRYGTVTMKASDSRLRGRGFDQGFI